MTQPYLALAAGILFLISATLRAFGMTIEPATLLDWIALVSLSFAGIVWLALGIHAFKERE
jgi:hypothetical protein